MVKKSDKGRKLILVPNDIVARLMEISNKQGKPFYNFVAETLEHALRVYSSGNSLEEVVDFYGLIGIYKSCGAKIVSDEVLNYLINGMYTMGKDDLHRKCYAFGQLCGKSLMAKHENPVQVLEKFLAATEWDLNEVAVEQEKGKVKIRCVSPILSLENTELLVKFVEGIMHEFNYKTEKQDYVKGIISLEYGKT
jgi:hypothetical protein